MNCIQCDHEEVEAEFALENPSPFIDDSVDVALCEDCYDEIRGTTHGESCDRCDALPVYKFPSSSHTADQIETISLCRDHYDPYLNLFKAQLED